MQLPLALGSLLLRAAKLERNRFSYSINLKGPSFIVNTACGSAASHGPRSQAYGPRLRQGLSWKAATEIFERFGLFGGAALGQDAPPHAPGVSTALFANCFVPSRKLIAVTEVTYKVVNLLCKSDTEKATAYRKHLNSMRLATGPIGWLPHRRN